MRDARCPLCHTEILPRLERYPCAQFVDLRGRLNEVVFDKTQCQLDFTAEIVRDGHVATHTQKFFNPENGESSWRTTPRITLGSVFYHESPAERRAKWASWERINPAEARQVRERVKIVRRG